MMKKQAIAVILLAGCIALTVGCAPEEEEPIYIPTLPTTATTTEVPTIATDPTEPTDPAEPTEPTEPTEATKGTTLPKDERTLRGQSIADFAKTQLGKPFVFGEIGPDAFDNSGFAFYCFEHFGITLPRTTPLMYEMGEEVARDALIPGDLVFYTMSGLPEAEYVGIYVGNDEFIACSNEERPVDTLGVTWEYFEEKFIGARRCF